LAISANAMTSDCSSGVRSFNSTPGMYACVGAPGIHWSARMPTSVGEVAPLLPGRSPKRRRAALGCPSPIRVTTNTRFRHRLLTDS
jgi:hypothetical protein